MSPDSSTESAAERLLTSLRQQLEVALRVHADELARTLETERGQAVEQARTQARQDAEAELTQLRSALAQHEESRRSSAAEIAELHVMLEELRRSTEQQIDAARRTIDAEIAAARGRAAADADEARRLAQARIDDLQREVDERTRAARQAEREMAELLGQMRSFEAAGSLSETLERLVTAAASCAHRVVVFTRAGEGLRVWRATGFADTFDRDRDVVDTPDGIVGAAVQERRAVRGSPGEGLPSFASDATLRDGVACPLMVAGTAVAVLYADRVRETPSSGTWMLSVEALSQHAGRVVETITVQQAAGLRAAAPVVGTSHGSAANPPVRGVR